MLDNSLQLQSLSKKALFFSLGLIVIFNVLSLLFIEQFGTHFYVLLLFVLTITLFTFLKPIIGLLICTFIAFSGIAWGLEIPYGFLAVVVLTGFAWLFEQATRMKFSIIVDVQFFWILGFLISILFSAFGAIDPIVSMEGLLNYVKLAFFYFLVIQLVHDKKSLELIILTIIAATIFSLIFGIIAMFVPIPFFGTVEQGFRFRGLTSDPNIMAIHILIIFPFLVFYFFRIKKNYLKLLISLLIIVSVLGLLATFSRSATIGFGVILLLILFSLRHKKILLLISLFSLLVLIVLVPDMFWERLMSLKNIYQDPSLRWRARLFIGALDQFLNNPVLGIGMGNFLLISHEFIMQHYAVHNTFLEIAAETGLVGLFFFISLIGSYLVRLHYSWKMFIKSNDYFLGLFSQGLLIAFSGVFISSLFLSIQGYFVLWTLFGIGTALFQQANSITQSEKLKD